MKPVLELRNIQVNRGGRTILEVDELQLNQGEVLAVIGPNGAGKSTLLSVMAGLVEPDIGEMRFQGKELNFRRNLSYRRRIGLVLQKPLLLSGSVMMNVTLGGRFRRISRSERNQSAYLWLARLGIAHLQDRPIGNLSGGEAQRVSLARAFAVNPQIVLLDEPFSALDMPTRTRLIEDFQTLLAETGMTTLFVTHDMNEALYLGHRVGVLLDGRIRQVDPPEQVFAAPADAAVASFVGIDTTITGRVMGEKDGHLVVGVGEYLLEAVGDVAVGRNVYFCLRPDDITLWSDDQLPASSARNRLSGIVSRIIPRGPQDLVVVDCGFQIRVLITRTSANEMALEPGKMVILTFKASSVHLIPF